MPHATQETGGIYCLVINRGRISSLAGEKICRVYCAGRRAVNLIENLRHAELFQALQGCARDNASHRTAFNDKADLPSVRVGNAPLCLSHALFERTNGISGIYPIYGCHYPSMNSAST